MSSSLHTLPSSHLRHENMGPANLYQIGWTCDQQLTLAGMSRPLPSSLAVAAGAAFESHHTSARTCLLHSARSSI